MRKNILLCCALLNIFLLIGCKKNNVRNNVQKMIGSTIIIPENLVSNVAEIDPDDIVGHGKCKLLVYFNSIGCTSCRMRELAPWKSHIQYIDSIQINRSVDYIFIFNTSRNAKNIVDLNLKTYGFDLASLYDNNGEFEKLNPLPENYVFHTFLLDRNSKVVLVGSPINNPKMWELYKSTIAKLNENDGTLPTS